MGSIQFSRPQLERLVHEWTPQEGNHLLFVGPPLIGKTHLLRRFTNQDDPLGRLLAAADASRPVSVCYRDCRFVAPGPSLLETIKADSANGEEAPPAFGLVLLLDNFDAWLAEPTGPFGSEELSTLLASATIVATANRPLREVGAHRTSAPVDSFRQIFLHLLEAREVDRVLRCWLTDGSDDQEILRTALAEWIGGHPFLLARTEDVLIDVAALLPQRQPLSSGHLPLIRLRLAEEHGRPLFDALWNELESAGGGDTPQLPGLLAVVQRLLRGPLGFDAISPDEARAVNWLLNRAMVRVDGSAYRLFSPLFQAYLQTRLDPHPVSGRGMGPAPSASVDLRTVLARHERFFTPQERNLLLYFLERPEETISVEELLEHVWRKPNGSVRRVQEGIRRLRRRLAALPEEIGAIENDWGRGYRFTPAHPESAQAYTRHRS